MNALKVVAVLIAVLFVMGLGYLVYLGNRAPEIHVYPGHQVPKRYAEELRSLDLLADDERIQYFYSDAMEDIRDGAYLVTDQKLTVYNRQWAEPAFTVELDEIASIKALYDDSFFVDSMVTVETVDGTWVEFPLSSEFQRDRDVVAYLAERSGVEPRVHVATD